MTQWQKFETSNKHSDQKEQMNGLFNLMNGKIINMTVYNKNSNKLLFPNNKVHSCGFDMISLLETA